MGNDSKVGALPIIYAMLIATHQLSHLRNLSAPGLDLASMFGPDDILRFD